METIELTIKQIKILLKKAYEWRAKVNKRSNRIDLFKTTRAIKRFKKFLKLKKEKFKPNKSEIIIGIQWFLRCKPKTKNEKLVFTFISLLYKLHQSKIFITDRA